MSYTKVKVLSVGSNQFNRTWGHLEAANAARTFASTASDDEQTDSSTRDLERRRVAQARAIGPNKRQCRNAPREAA